MFKYTKFTDDTMYVPGMCTNGGCYSYTTTLTYNPTTMQYDVVDSSTSEFIKDDCYELSFTSTMRVLKLLMSQCNNDKCWMTATDETGVHQYIPLSGYVQMPVNRW